MWPTLWVLANNVGGFSLTSQLSHHTRHNLTNHWRVCFFVDLAIFDKIGEGKIGPKRKSWFGGCSQRGPRNLRARNTLLLISLETLQLGSNALVQAWKRKHKHRLGLQVTLNIFLRPSLDFLAHIWLVEIRFPVFKKYQTQLPQCSVDCYLNWSLAKFNSRAQIFNQQSETTFLWKLSGMEIKSVNIVHFIHHVQ